MKIIYVYKKNVYAAYKAAYLHLKLDENSIPHEGLREINREVKPYYIGLDEDLNEVYIADGGRNLTIYRNVMEGLSSIYGEEIKIIDIK
ncbi:hypothetical protein CACET_c21590 [Clostridium aceticum]|uniref:Uncharacterized protein n=1 Tax=Clostridium aceticum TaxID=84022 RepID=A0A0G3WCL4_9CLOT|nr:DUF3189 family protein [Clostridium aceticum]AKL95605.1 hypothetical protein CACET_c21590 [Clostridium aceticum]